MSSDQKKNLNFEGKEAKWKLTETSSLALKFIAK